MTATWDSFFVDYQTAGMLTGVPAHVVGQQALGIDDPMEAKAALIDALPDQRRPTRRLKAISETYNTYFDATSLPEDPGVYAGYGPYNLVDFTDDGTMTFEAREDYTWGPQPHVQTIVYSIIGDPTAAVQAMENEEIDITQPQATADILTQLEGIADRGVEVIQDDAATVRAHRPGRRTTAARSTRRPTAATPRRPWPCGRRSSTPCLARTSSTG